MLKKISLDKTKIYERCIALEQITQMMCDFALGRSYKQEIGAEQGDILKWDDFVIVNEDASKTYIQVKRQSTDFWTGASGETVQRNTNRKGEIRKLSPFDETIEALSKVCQENAHNNDRFRIYLPTDSTNIKKGMQIRNLRNFKDSIKPVTQGCDLERQAMIDEQTSNVVSWLKTWCGFTDYNQIVKAFQMLEIYTIGYEADIMDRVEKNLKEIFINSKVGTVRDKLFCYLDDNSTYAGAFRPRQLLFELKEYLRPDFPLWTFFKADESSWIISGINDLESEEGEKAPMVVSATWNNNFRNNLKIAGIYSEKCKLTKSLMRLSIHQNGVNYTSSSDKSLWFHNLKKSVGETLGNDKNDCTNINILSLDNEIADINGKKISLLCDKERYAEDLNDAMGFERDLRKLYDLQNALTEWKNYEAGEDIKKKIKDRIGDNTPETFYEKLKEKIAKKEAEKDNIKIRKEAVDAFYDQITVESEQVQIQFGQINDTWKKILKRIVVNPLITSAPLLNNKTSRNQQIASTLAEINGEKFDISNIASEGQIADLQLSFILAMANKYSWTPWKALLLDDPMQHHDLVHASSAFDVLRDYIVELNYQIMLSTHDPLQADFFVRKLKNDEITSKVYQLIPGKGGITAERIG